jgi:hypothetical protein
MQQPQYQLNQGATLMFYICRNAIADPIPPIQSD